MDCGGHSGKEKETQDFFYFFNIFTSAEQVYTLKWDQAKNNVHMIFRNRQLFSDNNPFGGCGQLIFFRVVLFSSVREITHGPKFTRALWSLME